MKGAEPFLLSGDRRGVLLIHGFTGSPSEMRLAGEYLNNLGYSVLAPRLCGHGSSLEDMNQTSWEHWYFSVEDGYHLLSGICDEIMVVGLSLGALLALKLCTQYPIDKVISLSAPIYIFDKRVGMLPLVKMFRSYVPKKQRQKQKEILKDDQKYLVGYDATPLTALSSLLEFIEHMRTLLPEIKTPVLIIQSKNEHTVKPESAEHIYKNIGSLDKKIIWLEKSGHIITLGAQRQEVFKAMEDFLRKNHKTDYL